ncbi:MAG: nucleoside-triphosphatase [bacterium]
MNILLSGPPRVGKTTICRMIMDEADRTVKGFVTEDIHHDGERVGFMIEFDDGETRVLSHVDFDEPHVGKYGVDLDTMDWLVGKAANWQVDPADLFIADEVGKMELKHDEFKEIVEELLESDVDLLATIPKVGPDFVADIRSRSDVTVLEMDEDNREEVQTELVEVIDLKPSN